MKITMINDCASVGETLLKLLPKEFEGTLVKRSRSLWGKTLGVAWKSLKVKSDVYHVHYLLQDCYLASRFGKHPLVGHAHGSDIRDALKHKVLGRLVRHNLRTCEKILVATPDILESAREINETAEYLPNTYDENIFYVKPLEKIGDRPQVLIAGRSNWKIKGTDKAIRALSKIKERVSVSIIRYGKDFDETAALAERLGLKLTILPRVPHEEVRNYYWSSDVVIDQFPPSGTIGNVGIEAIACGRPVVNYISSMYSEHRGFHPLDINTEDQIADATLSAAYGDTWKVQHAYLVKNHNPVKVMKRLFDIYHDLAD